MKKYYFYILGLLFFICLFWVFKPNKPSLFAFATKESYNLIGLYYTSSNTDFKTIEKSIKTRKEGSVINKYFNVEISGQDNNTLTLTGKNKNWECIFIKNKTELYPYNINGKCYENNQLKIIFDDKK